MPSGIVLDIRNNADLHDDSRNHHTITNHNAIPVRGIHGRGMSFNGIDAYLDCGNHSSLNITDAITIEAWIKPLNLTGGVLIFCRGESTVDGYYFDITASGKIEIRTNQSGLFQISDTAVGEVVVNNWYHIVGTREGTNGRLYKNGIDVTSLFGTHLDPTSSFKTAKIGRYDSAIYFFNGTISSVCIYNYALSADEIKLHYRQQSPYYQEEAPTICL